MCFVWRLGGESLFHFHFHFHCLTATSGNIKVSFYFGPERGTDKLCGFPFASVVGIVENGQGNFQVFHLPPLGPLFKVLYGKSLGI